ncbi:MAG TPA: alpha/beta fold hydrolase [Burkholderiaceae bacterium]|nr:alpha/beta fold hydrolase [Burkholderiaceae bacterium]
MLLTKVHFNPTPGPFDIIFVHGLNGDRNTWTHNPDNADEYWPTWVGEDSRCDTWVLEYDAALSGWVDSAMPLPHQGSSMLDMLDSEPRLAGRPLILVGHSMGGLVIKTAIVHARTMGGSRFLPLADRVRGVVFIATPHQGSDLANLAAALAVLTRANDQVSDLKAHNAHLQTLNGQFLAQWQQLQFHARVFAEGKGVPLTKGWLSFLQVRKKVVSSDSANPHVPGTEVIHLGHADHFSICKPKKRRGEQIHNSLLRFITDCGAGDAGAPPVAMPSGNASSPIPMAPEPAAPATPAAPHAGARQEVGVAVRPPGMLSGHRDQRLVARELHFVGRQIEVQSVLAFLDSEEDAAVICAQVTGCGGIGKTEVCKAALRAWLERSPQHTVYYIDVPEDASVPELIDLFGRALGAPGLGTVEQLAAVLAPGLYYLDNLDSIASQPDGVALLRTLRQLDGVRLLVSSRVDVDGVLGRPINIDVLPATDALDLFRHLWAGQPLPESDDVARFVEQDLGNHALSIALTARLGRSYTFAGLKQRWDQVGAALMGSSGKSRLDSLQVSLGLTRDAVAAVPGALALWTLAALFPLGLEERWLSQFEQQGGWPDEARQTLALHHVWQLRDGRLHVLPPVARFALGEALRELKRFSWMEVREHAYMFFNVHATAADQISSASHVREAQAVMLTLFDALHRFVLFDARSTAPDLVALAKLFRKLRNLFQYQALLSKEMLCAGLKCLPKEARWLAAVGSLELRLGNVDSARAHLEQALTLFTESGDRVEQANVLGDLGDTIRRGGNFTGAQILFEQALTLYEETGEQLGVANSLFRLGRTKYMQRKDDAALGFLQRALEMHEQIGGGIGQGNVLLALGEVKVQSGAFEDAETFYLRAFAIFEREPGGLGRANTLLELGKLALRREKFVDARVYLERALVEYGDVQDQLGVANTYGLLGELEAALGNSSDAYALFERAMVLFRRERGQLGLIDTTLSFAKLAVAASRLDEASAHYQAAIEMHGPGLRTAVLLDAYLSLALCLHAQGRVVERDSSLISACGLLKTLGEAVYGHQVSGVLEFVFGDTSAAQRWVSKHDMFATAGGLRSLNDQPSGLAGTSA